MVPQEWMKKLMDISLRQIAVDCGKKRIVVRRIEEYTAETFLHLIFYPLRNGLINRLLLCIVRLIPNLSFISPACSDSVTARTSNHKRVSK
jgi:hypothetical protein